MFVGVKVAVGGRGVEVAVFVGVLLGGTAVKVAVGGTGVTVGVFVGVRVSVAVGVAVLVRVKVAVGGIGVTVGVLVCVAVGTGAAKHCVNLKLPMCVRQLKLPVVA